MRDSFNTQAVPEHFEKSNMSISELYEIAEITENYVTLVDDLEDFDPVYRKSEKFNIINRIMKVHAINKQLTNLEFN
jgi:hypothetical protein